MNPASRSSPNAISAVEAVFHFVPYRMRSPWVEDGQDPRQLVPLVKGEG